MIINYFEKFDKVFVWFGCVDCIVYFGFVDFEMVVVIFCFIYVFYDGEFDFYIFCFFFLFSNEDVVFFVKKKVKEECE